MRPNQLPGFAPRAPSLVSSLPPSALQPAPTRSSPRFPPNPRFGLPLLCWSRNPTGHPVFPCGLGPQGTASRDPRARTLFIRTKFRGSGLSSRGGAGPAELQLSPARGASARGSAAGTRGRPPTMRPGRASRAGSSRVPRRHARTSPRGLAWRPRLSERRSAGQALGSGATWWADRGTAEPVQFSRSVVSHSLRPHGLQHTRPSCPSPTLRACSNSCPSSWLCHPTISSSVVCFSSRLQSFPASGSSLVN